MDIANNHPFNFLSEISKDNTYALLFPDGKTGLAIIWLFEKLENGVFNKTFKEKDIHEAFRMTNPAAGNLNARHPQEHYNGAIANLQEYFLRYDEERQEYSFKEYAYTFCRQASEILKAAFSPTRIEKICVSLHAKLAQCDNEAALLDWFRIEFDSFKPQLKSQLDFLHRQIDQSVASLRSNKKFSLQEGTILETLQSIEARFEEIRAQNKELRTAFREIDQIRRFLEHTAGKYDSSELDTCAYSAILFFQEMRKTLAIIDKRLDRIQPKIKQLFSNLNKPLFNARTERFLYFMLEQGYETIDGPKKSWQLPQGIPPAQTVLIEQDISIVERKSDLFPRKAQRRVLSPQSPAAHTAALQSLGNSMAQQDAIAQSIERIMGELEIHQNFCLSAAFFNVLEKGRPLDFAIALLQRAVTFFSRDKNYLVQVQPHKQIRHPLFKTSIWEIMILKSK